MATFRQDAANNDAANNDAGNNDAGDNRVRSWSITLGTWAAILLVGQAGFAAENLVQNGSFDSDIEGWLDIFSVTAAWSTDDAAGSNESGSISVTYDGPGQTSAGVFRCFPLPSGEDGESFVFGAKAKIPSKQEATDGVSAQVGIAWWSEEDCMGFLDSDSDGVQGELDTWRQIARPTLRPGGARTVSIVLRVGLTDTGSATVLFDEVFLHPGTCAPSETALCLTNERFKVEVDWRDFEGAAGPGQVVGFRSDDSGLFYFFDANNWEMLVKVLDACSFSGHFWVFSAATTTVEYTLRVTDTQGGAVQQYFNPLGTAAPAITDTAAFATCP